MSKGTKAYDRNINKHGSVNKGKRFILSTKTLVLSACIMAIVALCVMSYIALTETSKSDMTWEEFNEQLESGSIDHIKMYRNEDYMEVYSGGQGYKVINPKNDGFIKDILDTGVKIETASNDNISAIKGVLGNVPIYLVITVLIIYFVDIMMKGASGFFKLANVEDTVTFDQVAGMEEIKSEVKFVVDFLKNPEAWIKSGARIPKGILLCGSPGTGKTLLAKAIAGEAGVPMVCTSGSDFCEVYAGLGSKRIREMAAYAREKAPCIIFIDEIDSLGGKRTTSSDGMSRENNQTLNALLKEMDGIGNTDGVVFIAATNFVDNLDDALKRPGRFDKQFVVTPPTNRADREAIVRVHLEGKVLSDDVDISYIAKSLIGSTGAQIESVINEAVINSIMRGFNGVIYKKDVEDAIVKSETHGVEKKNACNKLDMNIVATHEAGHAVMTLLCGKKVRKVTIVPTTSGVGGYTMSDDSELEEKMLKTEEEMYDELCILFAGKCAEELLTGTHTNGCSGDIKQASNLIYNMVTQFAMCGCQIDTSMLDKESIAEKMDDVACKAYGKAELKLKEKCKYIEKLRDRLLNEETISELKSLSDI